MKFSKPISLHPDRKQGFVEQVGRLGEPSERSINQARKFGRRRLAAVALPVAATAAALGLMKMNESLEARSAKHERKIEVCAGVLTGHTVELQRDSADGHLRVPADEYTKVSACIRAAGDVDLARLYENDILPIGAEQTSTTN